MYYYMKSLSEAIQTGFLDCQIFLFSEDNTNTCILGRKIWILNRRFQKWCSLVQPRFLINVGSVIFAKVFTD